jgi:hypothetical protein
VWEEEEEEDRPHHHHQEERYHRQHPIDAKQKQNRIINTEEKEQDKINEVRN